MSNFLQLPVKLLVCGDYGKLSNTFHLSELVKMYPCLYNKQEKDFKKEEVKQRAWKEMAKELDLENGKVIEQLWNNFKNLLSKRRTKLKTVDISGAAASPVNKTRKALEKLNYLSWLFPFVKVRKTKSNLSLAKERSEEVLMKISMKTSRITKTRITKTKVIKDITMKINMKRMN